MNTLPETSSKLLALIKDAQSPAWDEFFHCYWGLLVHWAQGSGLAITDAEEVAQQTLISLARSMPDFVYDRNAGRFRDYLGQILRNKIKDYWRNKLRRPPHVSLLDDDQPDRADPMQKAWAEEHRRHLLQKWLDQVRHDVSADDMQIFFWYFIEDEPAKKIGARTGIPSQHVANRAWKVLRKLREVGRGEDPEFLDI